MGKVFRDRSDLVAGGELADHIREALTHSSFLIVILTPGVRDSVWVNCCSAGIAIQ